MGSSEVTVGPEGCDFCGTDNVAIQAAVDHVAAAGGGTVRIAAGVYRMRDSLHLRSGVHIAGAGRDTVLRKDAEVRSALSADLGYGHFDVSLAEPDRFEVGMGVLIADDRAGGFYQTVATLTWRDGDRFGIDRMLNHDTSRGANGFVVSSFPVISGSGVRDALVSCLAVDGNRAQNPHTINGCRGGGVFLIQTRGVALRDVAVANVNGDGVSFQQTVGTVLEGCVCEDNAGLGLHPGSGSVGAVMRRCTCRRNGADGIFYCLRVSYSLCEDCTIVDNGRHGISIGGRDTDQLIRRATIRGNGACGVYFRPHDRVMAGNRNHIEACEIAGNCRSEGQAEIDVAAPVADVHLLDNRIVPVDVRVAGIRVVEGTEGVVVHGNLIDGPRGVIVEGDVAAVSREAPTAPLAVGPDAAPPDASRHLCGWGADPSGTVAAGEEGWTGQSTDLSVEQ